jgi:hypothetical protein
VKRILLSCIFLSVIYCVLAQEKLPAHIISMEEYTKAKTFLIKDLDKDTYVKFENTYVLDRYESRKPYFIIGDDGKKKRIDLYKFLLKEGMQELGTIIFYSNEKGTIYSACLPTANADSKIWEQYFSDIHTIEKTEPNYILKLSYVLSKEFSFQQFKQANLGKDISKEAGTYGSDICFPGDVLVSMADGSQKILSTIKAGDQIITVDALTNTPQTTIVKALAEHEAKNYSLTKILLLSVKEVTNKHVTETYLSHRALSATPNHPILTEDGEKPAGAVKPNDRILCKEPNGQYISYIVVDTNEVIEGIQKVYNIEAQSGTTFMMNGVMVKQKN